MDVLFYLIPVTLALGTIGLGTYLWALRDGQYDDLDGASVRILIDDDRPVPHRKVPPSTSADIG